MFYNSNMMHFDFFVRSDSEITGYALDALCNVLSNEPLDDGKKPFFHHIYVFVCTVHVLFNSSNVKVKYM